MNGKDYHHWLKEKMQECQKKMEINSPMTFLFSQKTMSNERKRNLLEVIEQLQEFCEEAIKKGTETFGLSNREICNQRHTRMECSERCNQCNFGINFTFDPNPFSANLAIIQGASRNFKNMSEQEQRKSYKRIKKEISAILKSK